MDFIMWEKEARLKFIPYAKRDDEAMRARNIYALTKRFGAVIVVVAVISIILAKEAFMRFTLGTFISICLFILAALMVVIVYRLNFMSLSAVLVAPLILLAIAIKLRKPHTENVPKAQNVEKRSYFSPLYIVAGVLIAYGFYLLIKARSGWVNGNVWDVVSPSFFTVYFLATLVLIAIIFFSRTQYTSKFSLIIAHAILSTTVFAIVLYPGNFGDPLGHMGVAQIMYSYGTWKPSGISFPFWIYWILKEKALGVFTASVAKLSLVDIYWVHTFGEPILWGIFVPLVAYNITKIIGGREKVSLLAALLSAFYASMIGWSARVSGMGMGLIFLFMSLYLTLRYLKSAKNRMLLLLSLLTAIVAGVMHPLPGIMAFVSIFLAVSLKKYETVKVESLRKARFILVFSFLICVLALPAIFLVNGLVYLYLAPASLGSAYAAQATVFSVERLLDTDLWTWVFGAYISYELKSLLHYPLITFLGVIGMAYTLKKGQRYERVLTMLMLSFFAILVINYRILNYTMVNVLFGPSRLWVLRDFVALPFAALTVNSLFDLFGKSASMNPGKVFRFKRLVIRMPAKRVFAMLLFGLSLSAYATSSIDVSYAWAKGLLPTELEVEAVKYIDEITDEKYIVITMPSMASVGFAFVGAWNPNKWYVYQKGSPDFGSKPSVSQIYYHMSSMGAGVGYFVASSFRTPSYKQVVAEASSILGLLKVLSNEYGEISIFEYRVAPLPTSPDVMAYWWNSPTAYFIQNDKMRVIINPETRTLEVVDFWSDPYETLDLNATLLDGESLGDLMSVEYYDPTGDVWSEWQAGQDVPQSPTLKAQFKFRMNFLKGSLVGVVEQGSPSVQLWWEGASSSTMQFQLGNFYRLYMPGLVEGGEAYALSDRDYGLFYTVSRTENVTLHPIYDYEFERSVLSYSDVVQYCNLTMSKGYVWHEYFSYEFGVKNNMPYDQWAFVEIWLPDKVYTKTFPPLAYSINGGETWISGLPYSRDPMETRDGAQVNWVLSGAKWANGTPGKYVYSTSGIGGSPWLLDNFTSSGGGQNRMIFGIYLPAEDEVLVKIGASLYYVEPRRITYWFTDSLDENYGLHNLQSGLLALYNPGAIAYVGGFVFSKDPVWLAVTENAGGMEKVSVTISGDAVISLLSGKEVDTTTDDDGDGVPDFTSAS